MRLPKWCLVLAVFCASHASAQQAAFVTVTGSNANYANGTMTANFQAPPNTAQSSYSGQRFPFVQSATLNGSGQWSLQVADNTSLYPPLSQWQLRLCSQQATYLPPPTCYTVIMAVTCIHNGSCSGSTLDLTSVFAAAPVPPGTGGTVVLNPNFFAGTDASGHLATLTEAGTKTTGGNTAIAWLDDFSGGLYDPRDPRWGAQDTPVHQAAALQKMSNQMACDMATGVITQCVAHFPQGIFYADNLQIAPGCDWEGVPQAVGGTTLRSLYNNHQLAITPISMTLTCGDGNSHTDSAFFTRVNYMTLVGCSTGGCSNAPGDTANYGVGGPGNVGLELATSAQAENIFAQAFGGYGMRISGQDAKTFHDRLYGNDAWYYFGGYKGAGESVASPETSVTTTGTTSSVTLNWTAAASATGYAIYRGTAAGAESLFYTTATNSFTDTGAAGTTGTVTNVVSTAVAAPGTITPTGSTTGGTLAAGTYFYKVTSLGADTFSVFNGTSFTGWHGSIEFTGLDVMADWIEAYGFQDPPTASTYHHLADILGGGGDTHFDHLWPQLGLVGIAQPFGMGAGDNYENIRIDFTRLEGFWTTDGDIQVRGGLIDGSCTASNARTVATQQPNAGTCDQLYFGGQGGILSDIRFLDNAGFGPTFKTADYYAGSAHVTNLVGGPEYTGYTFNPTFPYTGFGPDSDDTQIFAVSGATPDMTKKLYVSPADSSPVTETAFLHVIGTQHFYVFGGNANVTIQNNANIHLCSGQNVNLGRVAGWMEFQPFAAEAFSTPASVAEVCPSSAPIAASSETVTFSATPAFSIATRASIITLTGNVTGFTLAAGADGQEKTLEFCQDATGSRTVAGVPANVRGFMTIGSTLSKCSSQHFTYSAGQTAWLADSPGVTNE